MSGKRIFSPIEKGSINIFGSLLFLYEYISEAAETSADANKTASSAKETTKRIPYSLREEDL
jgi:hypothetical protein